MENKKTGLVMEGGGMKGMYTAGVIDVFLENNIQTDVALGTSAGAVFGCNYKSRQIGRAIRYVSKYRNDWRFGSVKSFLKTGDFFGVDFCYKDIPNKLDIWDAKTFSENPLEFYAVCTDIEKGEAYYHKLSDGGEKDIQYLRASGSVPIISQIVEIDGRKFLDGGLTCSIPLAKAIELGCKKNIVICTKLEGQGKDGMSTKPLLRFIYRKFPNFVKNINECEEAYKNESALVKECSDKGTAFVIRPSHLVTDKVAEKDVSKLRELYELGRSDALNCLEDLKKFLQN